MKIHVEAPLIGFNWTMLFVFVSFVVLYFILKKFLWEKVHNFMQAREQKIVDAFENAAEAGKIADARALEYSDKLAEIAKERRDALSEAKLKADEHAKLIIKDAEEKASGMLARAREDIEREKEKAVEEMRRQVAMLAIYAAERILEKQLDAGAQRAIVDGIISETGSGVWKI